MTKFLLQEKIHASYLHTCLKYVNRVTMTNKSLRERLGIDDKNSALASRIINNTITEGLIKRENPESAKIFPRISSHCKFENDIP